MASSSSNQLPWSSLDSIPEFWYACAGELVETLPSAGTKVYYYVQGHVEHASRTGANVNLEKIRGIPHRILCTVVSVNYCIESGTDDVFAKIKLAPLMFPREDEIVVDAVQDYSPDFPSKKLLKTDIKTGTLYLTKKFDDVVDPPGPRTNTITCIDIHGKRWTFSRAIPRGLSTKWTAFRNEKGLQIDDTVMFWRDRNRVLRIGIQRQGETSDRVRIDADDVVHAAMLGTGGKPFEVVYFPRIGTPEFVVRASRVDDALRVAWAPGDTFTMAAADSQGFILASGPAHPMWTMSEWRLLQVSVNFDGTTTEMRVSPWMLAPQHHTVQFRLDGKFVVPDQQH